MPGKLANAPLIEVVFEIRWATPGTPPFVADPGFAHLMDSFTDYAKKVGFGRAVDMQTPPYAVIQRSVARRFYKDEGNFPILQIGPGTFASNASAEYEWEAFKRRGLSAAKAVVDNYPKFKEHKLNIKHVELRYIDTFDENVASVSDIRRFLGEATNIQIVLPDFWDRKDFGLETRGRILLDVDLQSPQGAKFSVDIGSANVEGTPVIRMETKVSAAFDNVLPSTKAFGTKAEQWLEAAHEVTSPAFRSLIQQSAFEKFQ